MKIAFFNYLPLAYGGGTAKYFIDTSAGLENRFKDIDITIVTFGSNLTRKILFLYSLYYGKKLSAKERKISLINIKYLQVDNFKMLKNILADFDCVYSKNDILELSLLKYLVGFKSLPPVIIGCHTTLNFFQLTSWQAKLHNLLYGSFFYKNLLKNAYKIHVLNKNEEEVIKRMLPNKIVVKIGNPFDFTKFAENAFQFRYAYHWNKKKINILWIGRLTKEKGVGDLLTIINKINKTDLGNRIVWNIVGDGELKNKIVNFQKKWQNVCFLNDIGNKYLASVYKENDLFISTSSGEAYPFTLLEAQCFGLPVIAYENYGTAEIIKNKETGYLIKTRGEFIETLTRYLKKPILKPDFIKINVKSKFASEKNYQQLYQLFTF